MTATQQAMNLLCLNCSVVLDESTRYNEHVCERCYIDAVWECSSCGDIHANTSTTSNIATAMGLSIRDYVIATDYQEPVCYGCVQTCEICGTEYSDHENAMDCCGADYGLHSWDYKPKLNFFRDSIAEDSAVRGVLYMGIELEVEKMAEYAYDFIRAANDDYDEPNFLFTKSDGSLSETGVEIVTMPATLKAFKELWPQDAMDKARDMGARSFRWQNCGFHIHVSRSAFMPSHMWKFVRFQMRNSELCQRVGQRENSSYAEWWGIQDNLSNLPNIVKGKNSNRSRYIAINFQRSDTVELRYFKGNILQEAIMKNVEFVDSIYEYTKQLSSAEIIARNGLSRRMYLLWLARNVEYYPNLYSFLTSQYPMTEESD